jgi:hypothetical protein
VRDNVTGLVWEVKTDDGGIHDKDNIYRWGGKTAIGYDAKPRFGSDWYSDWDSLIEGSNNATLCGFTDWRVPVREELRSIVDYSRTKPAIDTNYFPNTPSSRYWTSSPNAGNHRDAWNFDFSNGNDNLISRFGDIHVRLVRGGSGS